MTKKGGPKCILVALLLGCQPVVEVPEVVIGGLDYTFDVPSTLPAGLVEIGFENRGNVTHEAILVELKEGVTFAQLVETVQSGGDTEVISERIGGILFAEAGESSWGRILVDLTSGRTYALVCTLQDTDDAPPHVALGMIKTFEAS